MDTQLFMFMLLTDWKAVKGGSNNTGDIDGNHDDGDGGSDGGNGNDGSRNSDGDD